jgi:hypothetical protein
MTSRFSLQFVWLLAAACAAQPKSGVNHKTIQREVAADVARVCALPPDERQAEIERIRSNDGVAIVCPRD